MKNLTELYQLMQKENINLFDYKIPNQKANTICFKNRYGIFIDSKKIKTTKEEKCIIAHELGHCKTGSTHKIYSSFELISRHEYRANKWAIQKLIPYFELEGAFKKGIIEVWELAEYFEVTEGFVRKAIELYGNFNITKTLLR